MPPNSDDNIRYQVKYKDWDQDWESIEEGYMCDVLGANVKDVDLALKMMHEGEIIETMFSFLRMKPIEEDSDVDDLIAFFKSIGDQQTASQLTKYLARGDIRNVDSRGNE